MASLYDKKGSHEIYVRNQLDYNKNPSCRDMDVVNSVIQGAINHNYQYQSQQQHLYGQLDSYYHNNLINHIRLNNYQNAKDNKSNARSVNKRSSDASNRNVTKGLQILDFHESWMEEMKSYKNMYVNQLPQMLSLHNHVQAAQSYQLAGEQLKKRRKAKNAATAQMVNARRNVRQNKRKDAGSDVQIITSSTGIVKPLEKEENRDENQVRVIISPYSRL